MISQIIAQSKLTQSIYRSQGQIFHQLGSQRFMNRFEAQNQTLYLKDRYQLPEISSPSLKKTVYKIVSEKRLPNVSSIQKRVERETLPTNKSKKTNAIAIHAPSNQKQSDMIQNQKVTNSINKISSLSRIKSKQLTRAHSQSKDIGGGQECSNDITNSKGILSYQKFAKSKQLIYKEIKSYGHSPNQTQNLESKNGWFPIEQSLKISQEKKQSTKTTNFARKHQLYNQLYGEERAQLKLINSIIKANKGDVSQIVKIKNYTKFIPKIITIEED